MKIRRQQEGVAHLQKATLSAIGLCAHPKWDRAVGGGLASWHWNTPLQGTIIMGIDDGHKRRLYLVNSDLPVNSFKLTSGRFYGFERV